MDYEQKYKEALERAKNLIALYPQDAPGYREVFPELKESKDERMRKAALEGIKYLEREMGWDAIDDIDILDVKEYLEKQKEQNLIMAKSPQLKEQKPIVLSDKFEIALEEFLMNARDVSEKTFAEDVREYADKLREIVINEKKEQKPGEIPPYVTGIKGDPDPAGVWKPSEEQMEAFSSYIKDFQEKAEAAVGGWNNFDAMIRLYEQLKKL